jgi:hypothetical protein
MQQTKPTRPARAVSTLGEAAFLRATAHGRLSNSADDDGVSVSFIVA